MKAIIRLFCVGILGIIFLIAPMFSPTYAASPQAQIDSPSQIKISGEEINAQATGTNLQKIGIYWARPDSYLDSDENWDQHEIESHNCGKNEKTSCAINITFTPTPDIYGADIILTVKAWDDNDNKCMGHPKQSGSWTSLQGVEWQRCGSADFKQVKILTPDASDFTTPDEDKNKKKKKPKPTPTPIRYNCTFDPSKCTNTYLKTLGLCQLTCIPK